jgi:hypothetical protein
MKIALSDHLQFCVSVCVAIPSAYEYLDQSVIKLVYIYISTCVEVTRHKQVSKVISRNRGYGARFGLAFLR